MLKTKLILGSRVLFVCAALAAPLESAILSQSFDSCPVGAFPAQGEWYSPKGDAEVEEAAPLGGKGRALRLRAPFGSVERALASERPGAVVTLSFRLRLATTDSKLLFYALDASGRAAVLFYHDTGKNWGFASRGQYQVVPDSTVPGAWLTVILAMDFDARTYGAWIDDGRLVKSLFTDRAFKDPAADGLSRLRWTRNGQGDEAAIHLDDIDLVAGRFAPTPVEAPTDRIVVSPLVHPRHGIYPHGAAPEWMFEVRRVKPEPDSLDWRALDYRGAPVASGSAPVPALTNALIRVGLPVLPAGYFAIHAKCRASGLAISRAGSRPQGFATVGVLPERRAILPTSLDGSRFGIQGTTFVATGLWTNGDPFQPVYGLLGARWVNLMRCWSRLEPDRPGTFSPKGSFAAVGSGGEEDFMAAGGLVPLVCVNGLPQWAIDWPAGVARPKGKLNDQAYPPSDWEAYGAFLEKVARETAARRRDQFPGMKRNYYQIQWEPDWHYKGSDGDWVRLYRTAHGALHRGDPDAVVLGPGSGVLAKTVEILARLLPMGLADFIDGVATHAYYLPFGNPNATSAEGKLISPEEGGLIAQMRALKALMARHLKPGAPLLQTEWGLDYRGRYLDLDPALLPIQAALFIRGHLALLGEGADATFFFYASDYGNLETRGEDGYGMLFNLTLPKPSFGATHVSPKPVFMAAAAMTRLLEGTGTIGPLATPPGIHAYLFSRQDAYLLAAWSTKPDGAPLALKIADAGGIRIDFMGNESAAPAEKGLVRMELSEFPSYLLLKSKPQVAP
ncbi:MAG: hypothetical protein J0L75_20720 [Spirochaetes bacterium]|nr:hypothetical protein [Spirochaetota bacterium]